MTDTINAHSAKRIADYERIIQALEASLRDAVSDRDQLAAMAATYRKDRDAALLIVEQLRADIARTEALVGAQECVLGAVMDGATKGENDETR